MQYDSGSVGEADGSALGRPALWRCHELSLSLNSLGGLGMIETSPTVKYFLT